MSSPPPKPSAIADPGSGPGQAEALIGADRALMVEHVRAGLRPAFGALWGVDAAMGDVVARSTEPALAAIKLAWWRDQLEALDSGSPPAEPNLQAVAEHLLARGIGGAELSGLEPGWATLLDRDVDAALVADRGATLFGIGGRLLCADDPQLADAGALWTLVSVGRRGVPELLGPASEYLQRISGHRFARGARALTGLARLAARDLRQGEPFEPEGTAGRAAEMLRHRWSGRISRG